MKKNKLLTSGIAVVSAAAVLFGGTFAWQSISQRALNEVSASVNPGGRLHDDFNDVSGTITLEGTDLKPMAYDKDVYVENFTTYATNGVQVFARVRLDEYMELGENAGKLNDNGEKDASNKAVSIVAGARLDDKSTWTTHKFGDETDANNPFHQYWNWTMGGKTVYMPTFNTNKDSLEADINGSFKDNFASYQKWEVGASTEGNAIYDVDAAEEGQKETDEIVAGKLSANDIISGKLDLTSDANWDSYWSKHIDIQKETHTAKETLDATLMSMAEYKEKLETDDTFDGTGNFWVYDEDGWAYWANPIDPETATGLLLNGINRNATIINQDWYYAINVVAQFVTGDDLGSAEDGTGFYDLTEGSAPSADALVLLNNIGVQINHTVSNAEELAAALELGGIVTVKNDITLSEVLTIGADTVLNLGDHTLTTSADVWKDTKEECAMLYVDGVTLTINDGNFVARENDALAVTVGNGGKVVINGGTFKGNYTALYVHEGEAVIYGGDFSIQQPYNVAGKEYNYVLNCYNENYSNGTAKITVCGGTFHNFDPASETAGDDGSFVPAGYTSKPDGNGVYTVTKNANVN